MTALEIIALIILTPLGFLAGAAGTVYTQIIRPIRRRRISIEEQDYRNIKAIFNTLPRPAQEIPSTIRKSHF